MRTQDLWERCIGGIVLTFGLIVWVWVGGTAQAAPEAVQGTGVQVFGVVTDNDLVSLEGVLVEIFETGTSNLVASTATAADGTYSLSVAAGTYDLSYTPVPNSGFREVNLLARPILEDVEQNVALVPVDLVDVRFEFVDRDGVPVANIEVRLTHEETDLRTIKLTGDDGVYSAILRAGEYGLRLRRGGAPGAATAPRSYDVSGSLSITEDLERTFVMPNLVADVTVLDRLDNPVPGVVVSPSEVLFEFEPFPGLVLVGTGGSSVTTDAEGRGQAVQFPGSARFYVSPPADASQPDVATDTFEFSDDFPVVVRLPAPVIFSGTLQDRDGNLAFEDRIRLVKAPINTGRVTEDGTGRFSLPMVPETYELRLANRTLDDPANFPRSFDLRSSPTFELLADREEDIRLPNVFLEVTVLDPDNQPVPDSTIVADCLAPVAFDLLPGLPAVLRRFSDIQTTDASGQARNNLFPCTRSRLRVVPPEASGLPARVFTDIEVLDDASFVAQLARPIRWAGVQRDRAGTPIPGQRNILDILPQRVRMADRTTDASGELAVNLEPASYAWTVVFNGGAPDGVLIPDSYTLFGQSPLDLTSDRLEDMVFSARLLDVEVVDPNGTPIPDTSVQARNLNVSNGRILAETEVLGVRLRGGIFSDDTTSPSGEARLVLFPPLVRFSLVVTPPDGSGFAAEVVSDLTLDEDDSILVVLQFLNQVPIAEAGATQVVEATSAVGAVAAIDGTASLDPDDDPLTFAWTEGGELLTTEAATSLQFALGPHQVTLTVRDPQDAFDEDELEINIVDTTPPDTVITSAVGLGGLAIGDGSTTASTEITFEFIGIDLVDVAGFDCSFAGAEFASCADPRPFTDLSEGSYTFAVRAFDSAGNVDPTPATFLWTVASGPGMVDIPTQSTWGLLAFTTLLAWMAARRIGPGGRGGSRQIR